MKNIKLILLICLIFASVLTIAACGGEPVGTETAPQTSDTTTPATVVETSAETTALATTTVPATTVPVTTEKKTLSLTIGETPISDYKIIYARSEYAGYAKIPTMKDYLPIYDFNRETATRLSDMIFDLTGVRLKIAEDYASKATDNEILIGNTNRLSGQLAGKLNSLGSDNYLIDVADSKLIICGGEYGTTWHALDYLEELFASLLSEGKTAHSFGSDYAYNGSFHLIRIGCIGDSITEAANIGSGREMVSYPAQMGRILWKDALVTNLGSSGATMRDDLNAYTQRGVYSTALNIAAEVDLFTIMLGTNDSFFDGSWDANDSAKFNEDCLDIVNSLWQKNKNLNFVLANCPHYFGSGGWSSATVRLLQKGLVTKMNDAGYPTTFYDTYTATADLGGYFPDQLHPDEGGYLIMAQRFAEFLQPIIASMQK